MSNSARAKTRRSKRGRATKHQRGIMSNQHFGDRVVARKSEIKNTESIPDGPSRLERRMQELKDRL